MGACMRDLGIKQILNDLHHHINCKLASRASEPLAISCKELSVYIDS